MFIYAILIYLPILIIIYKSITSKFKLIVSLFIWTFFVWIIKKYSPTFPPDPTFYSPALIGGYLFISIFIYLSSQSKTNILLILSALSWTFFSFLYPYVRTPENTIGTHHRYLIVSALGFALLIGYFYATFKDRNSKLLLIFTLSIIIIIHSSQTFHHFQTQIKYRGNEISSSVWQSIPRNNRLSQEIGPFLYYFEGDSAKLYHIITFGFPPHMALDYDQIEGNKIPVPIDNWQEIITSVTTGKNLPAYGYPPEPVSIDKIYAFQLKGDKLIDITNYKRDELKFLLNK